MTNQSILWRRVDEPGHEACRVYQLGVEWRLEGTAVFSDAGRACRLSYAVQCDSRWNTARGEVSGWVGDEAVDFELLVDAEGRWSMNGVVQPDVDGCVDLDLNFSPSTNLLPIRRLGLEVGGQAEVRAAWLRFPSFNLEPLSQVYSRLDEFTYRYSSRGGEFVAELTVNDAGLVTVYPGLWEAENGR